MRRAWSVIAALAACHRAPAPGRERVLDQIPADAATVLAADGPVLAHARFRPVVDALRPHIPASFGCVVDAALASDHVAVGMTAEHGITVAIDTRATVRCRALSKVGALWVGTLGSGALANGDSVLAAPELARARPYLMTAPVALARAAEDGELLITMQPEPLEAWLAFDGGDQAVAAAEVGLRAQLMRMAVEPATAPFATRISVTRDRGQLVARLTGPVAADLALAVRAILRWAAPPAEPPRFGCPSPPPPVIASCDGTSFVVRDLQHVLDMLAGARTAPVIVNGLVTGLRIDREVAPLALRKGDVVVGIDGRALSNRHDFDDGLRDRDRERIELTVRRGTAETVLRLSQLGR